MNIAIIGYGKMGQVIERIALERGHQVTLKITVDNAADLNPENLKEVDVAIEFTTPENAVKSISICLENNVPIVVGTTGWYHQFDAVKQKCSQHQGTLLYATNCSVGVNLFFKLNEQLAKLMNNHPDYEVKMDEVHHTQKLDIPSGTAITLAEGIITNLDAKTKWGIQPSADKSELFIEAHRIENVPGTHQVTYSSAIDDIEIKHTAHNREGFAQGAVIAAEFIHNKKGIYTMQDVLFG